MSKAKIRIKVLKNKLKDFQKKIIDLENKMKN